MSLPTIRSILVALAIVVAHASAQADSVAIPTRFGELKTNADGDLLFKGKGLSSTVNIPSSAYVISTYKLQASDVVLISQAAGNACPGQFVFVSVSAEGAKTSPVFGTCYDDEVKPVQAGESISFTMKKSGGKGSVRYVYERSVVLENGKPVK